MKTRLALVLIVVTACTLSSASSANAQCNGQYGYGYGYWDIGRLYGVLADNVPYYAAFPPVYYSVPVPRTYGYSPFAYPPGYTTPDVVVEAQPLELLNPHVPAASSKAEETVDQVTAAEPTTGPLVIINPYMGTTKNGPTLRTAATNR